LHQKIALCAGVLVLSFAASTSVSAQQPAPPYYPGAAHPGTVYPDTFYPGRVYVGPAPALPPHEILASTRSIGLEPLSRPMRFGPAYSLRAADPAGREVRVIADAYTGRILKVAPVLFPRYAGYAPPPPPYGGQPAPAYGGQPAPAYGGQPGRITAVPDGYGPNSRIATLPPGAEGPPPDVPAAGGLPAVRAPAAVPQSAAPQAGPPLPRPRPKLAATDSTAPPGATAASAAQPTRQAETREAKNNETTGAIAPAAPSARV
jgi:hypothetical protein